MKVIKFGGSSLADSDQIKKVINIVKSDSKRKCIVVSAPGKRNPADTKVTDLLIRYANQAIEHNDFTNTQNAIIDRYQEIANGFGITTEGFSPIKQAIKELPEKKYPNDEYLMAAFKAHGEKLNAQLIAKVLSILGIKARYLDPADVGMIVSNVPDDAQIAPESYCRIAKWKLTEEILVVPGFFAYNSDGDICTFSRGGSDITGSVMARGLDAELYENFTDVDAIFSANPNVVKNPHAIAHMTFREMRELSYAGFSVFHDEALIPAIQGNISVNVRNTNNPDAPGTIISSKIEPNKDYPVRGISASKNFCGLYISKYLLNKEVGFTRKVLNILFKNGVGYEHMPSGIDDITIIMDENNLTPEIEHAIMTELQDAIHPDEMHIIHNYAIVMVVGEGMRNTVGVMARATKSLANAGIRLQMINQGASELSIMFGVSQDDADKAVQALHTEFFKKG
ncbi:aspartate kinase [Paucilactobacillus oligofermentans DSM 15707 = LMG 22743]|uniref:Aspartokinase n=1 Tax=Paucilactobacillus oligofermentans DSM 15707 = LMG 22743 TaxID=1423778 RepID=A0A0R1RUQ0_9LACO|nr:aspartate kinase [Paucilactobacillus oligofermentans]KRL57954.1 aspartate kinase [Paucilactobacillus oligofermentans DSM 15707 = LMG 22743]CUS26574.1 Aspartate kinase family protein [Paucilactobacillus oligofermentans DSM 15707 = LMG 22743]